MASTTLPSGSATFSDRAASVLLFFLGDKTLTESGAQAYSPSCESCSVWDCLGYRLLHVALHWVAQYYAAQQRATTMLALGHLVACFQAVAMHLLYLFW